MSKCDPTFDLKINEEIDVGHIDLYFILLYIMKTILINEPYIQG